MTAENPVRVSFINCGRGFQENTAFEFVSPPEAPTFYPSEQEFAAGPLAYVRAIRPQAEAYGLCKIVPPKSFRPDFAIQSEQFTFTPRVQRLNELEAMTRVRLNFLEQVIKFWDLQGHRFKIPFVDRKLVDLHLLHRVVQSEGGFEQCTRERKWSRVAFKMGYSSACKTPVASLLRQHYERLLFPYDVFLSGATITPETDNSDLCVQCSQSDGVLVSCLDCNQSSHLHCLIPALNEKPKGNWHCPRCIANRVQKQSQPEFGFAQSARHYTLKEFKETADEFKQDYFRTKETVPLAVVEKEFWRILESLEDPVTVEYGADLHTNEYGSGFASSNDPWNLNNLPVLEDSVFKHINSSISGMIVPWMYVGMCFSTFCWHNEDHWSYSINFLHWADAKSWYGVPGADADAFEQAIKKVAPELFASQPDLLHQLVTICNPNLLGVPVYKVHQQKGEFVVTFPRAYHAGFNQGINFAEAVNFAPADWLPIGRVCVQHYALLHRFPVFSHDELVCKMATQTEALTPAIKAAVYHDLISMLHNERQLRLNVFEFGVTAAERCRFELLPDDERQCFVCKTTCFLSAVTCRCQRLACLVHFVCRKSCLPEEHVLKYRYTLDELPLLLHD